MKEFLFSLLRLEKKENLSQRAEGVIADLRKYRFCRLEENRRQASQIVNHVVEQLNEKWGFQTKRVTCPRRETTIADIRNLLIAEQEKHKQGLPPLVAITDYLEESLERAKKPLLVVIEQTEKLTDGDYDDLTAWCHGMVGTFERIDIEAGQDLRRFLNIPPDEAIPTSPGQDPFSNVCFLLTGRK